ncbi:MAG: alanine racemase [Meiothermus sp.]
MRPAWLEVNLDSLAHNLNLLRSKAGNVPAIGVIKANAYGHGAVEIGKELVRLGVWGLAVATVEEARELRQARIEARILLMGSLHPTQADEVIELGLIPTLSTVESAEALDARARATGKKVEVHLEFDTGMGRTGFPVEDAHAVKKQHGRLEGLEVGGIYSHFADAEENLTWTEEQIANFAKVQAVFGPQQFYHLCNTAGTVNFPRMGLGAVRPGIGLYGLLPDLGLKPVARLLAKPTLVKQLPPGRRIGYGGLYTTQSDEWIATLPVGYADGMPRLLYNRATVRLLESLDANAVCPVVGRISMDQITVRLPGPVGLDTVFAIATADFDPRGSLWGWAELTGTVSYEPAVRLAARLPRVYLRGGVEVARQNG